MAASLLVTDSSNRSGNNKNNITKKAVVSDGSDDLMLRELMKKLCIKLVKRRDSIIKRRYSAV